MTGNDIRTNKRICYMNQYAWGIEAVQQEGADVDDIKDRVIEYNVDVGKMNYEQSRDEATYTEGAYFNTTPTEADESALNQLFLITCDAIKYRQQPKVDYSLIRYSESDEGGERFGDGKTTLLCATLAVMLMDAVSAIENSDGATPQQVKALEDLMAYVDKPFEDEEIDKLIAEANGRGLAVRIAGTLAWGCEQPLGFINALLDRWSLIAKEIHQSLI